MVVSLLSLAFTVSAFVSLVAISLSTILESAGRTATDDTASSLPAVIADLPAGRSMPRKRRARNVSRRLQRRSC